MPGVHISIADVGSVASRTVTTDNDGFYNVPALPPGGYEMTVSAPGFVTQLVTTINVAAGAERVLNVAMRPGDPQQTVRTAGASRTSKHSFLHGGWKTSTPLQYATRH